MTAAAFVDRDGVLNALVPDPVTGKPESPLDPGQVALLPGAAAAIRRLRDAGYVVVCISNQPAAAKGLVEMRLLESVHERVLELLEREGAGLDAWRLCFHHPEGSVPDLTCRCDCRKPAPGLLLDAAVELGIEIERSWMIGDTDADIAAGAAAGCRTVLVEHPASAHKRRGGSRPDARAADLATAAELITSSGPIT